MTLRFMDSFDHYATADWTEKWDQYTGAQLTIGASNGRNSTGGATLTLSGSATAYVLKALVSKTTWYTGFAFQYNAPPTGDGILVNWLDGSNDQVSIKLMSTGKLGAYRGSAKLGETTFGLSQDQWYYIEFKVTIDNSSGVFVIKVNGDEKLNLTSQDTQETGNATADTIKLFGIMSIGAVTFYMDDLYACDSDGSMNNNFLGDIRVSNIFPDGAGNYSQWTPSTGSNWENVDESAPDGDTTYNESSTATDKDSFTFGSLPGGITGTVKGLQVLVNSRKTDAGTRTVRPFVRISSTDYNGTSENIGDSWNYHNIEIWEQNPNTSTDWTIAEINALEAGYELVA